MFKCKQILLKERKQASYLLFQKRRNRKVGWVRKTYHMSWFLQNINLKNQTHQKTQGSVVMLVVVVVVVVVVVKQAKEAHLYTTRKILYRFRRTKAENRYLHKVNSQNLPLAVGDDLERYPVTFVSRGYFDPKNCHRHYWYFLHHLRVQFQDFGKCKRSGEVVGDLFHRPMIQCEDDLWYWVLNQQHPVNVLAKL